MLKRIDAGNLVYVVSLFLCLLSQWLVVQFSSFCSYFMCVLFVVRCFNVMCCLLSFFDVIKNDDDGDAISREHIAHAGFSNIVSLNTAEAA